MHLVLVLPGLSTARTTDAAPVRAPALARLLASAGPAVHDGDGIDAALAARYGIGRQTDWPLAAIRATALGLDTSDGYWLAADPVTLVAGRDDVAFAGVVIDLARDDADALVAALNAHFAGDSLVFAAPQPDAIFARVAVPPRLSTQPPMATPDRPLRARLPDGPDAAAWRRWQSEIQMLLHEHPVNAARERAGRPPANSVWFSAGGTLPPRPAPVLPIRTFAEAGIAVALAAHVGSPARPVPAALADAFAAADDAGLIVVALESGRTVEALEASWAAPAWQALAAGRLSTVTLLTGNAGDAVTWRAQRPRLWQRLAGHLQRQDLAALIAAGQRRD